jgi:hypothetical protein
VRAAATQGVHRGTRRACRPSDRTRSRPRQHGPRPAPDRRGSGAEPVGTGWRCQGGTRPRRRPLKRFHVEQRLIGQGPAPAAAAAPQPAPSSPMPRAVEAPRWTAAVLTRARVKGQPCVPLPVHRYLTVGNAAAYLATSARRIPRHTTHQVLRPSLCRLSDHEATPIDGKRGEPGRAKSGDHARESKSRDHAWEAIDPAYRFHVEQSRARYARVRRPCSVSVAARLLEGPRCGNPALYFFRPIPIPGRARLAGCSLPDLRHLRPAMPGDRG